MSLIKDDDLIQQLAADGADQALHEGTLPGRTRRRHNFLDVQAGQTAPYFLCEDAIAVADEITRRRLEGEGLPQLPAHPFRSRRRRDLEVDDLASLVAENDEDVEQAKGHRGNDEEVHRGQRADVVGQEGTPGLRGRFAMTRPPHVLGHGRFGDLMSQQAQLGLDAWGAPGRVVASHAPNERLDFLGQWRTPDPFCPGLPAPPQAETLLVPADDSLWLNDDECGTPIGPPLRQTDPKEPVASAQVWPWALSAEDSQLLTQSQVFQDELAARQQEQAENAPDSTNQSPSVVPCQRIGCRNQALAHPGCFWSGG
jgi:hypothetical protein